MHIPSHIIETHNISSTETRKYNTTFSRESILVVQDTLRTEVLAGKITSHIAPTINTSQQRNGVFNPTANIEQKLKNTRTGTNQRWEVGCSCGFRQKYGQSQ